MGDVCSRAADPSRYSAVDCDKTLAPQCAVQWLNWQQHGSSSNFAACLQVCVVSSVQRWMS